MQPTDSVPHTRLLVALGAFALIALFSLHPTAQAQDADQTTREDVQERRDVRRAEAERARAAFEERASVLRADAASSTLRGQVVPARTQLPDAATNRVRAITAALIEQLESGITRTETLVVRIETRALELEARGIDTDVALAYLDSARASLREAAGIVSEELPTEVTAALADDEPRAAFAYVTESAREAAAHIRSAREALRSSVTALKEAVRTQNERGAADAVRTELP